ncbi:MAG: hypothetical protein SFY92_12175 [Verrucomicrobiae bacterium]|nr:hypothetical protein [Verrucomicrobiae bacterium]
MNKIKFLLLAIIAIIGIAFGAIWLFNIATGSKPCSVPWQPKRSKAEIHAACLVHVQEADRKATEAIARRAAEFSSFVQSRKAGAKPFSKDIVSLYGKWRAVKPYLPFTDKEGHKKFVVEKFNQHIFTSADLASAVKLSVEGSVKDMEGIENELAVALRQEVLGRSLSPGEIPIAAQEFKKAVERIVSASQWDAAKTAGNLVVSEVAAQVGTQVLIRLGVSAGILTTGAVNSWWSLGAAFVIGLVVDVVWEWIDDPAGDIEKEMTLALDNLSNQGSTAIREEMTMALSKRCDLWKKTVEEIAP